MDSQLAYGLLNGLAVVIYEHIIFPLKYSKFPPELFNL